MKRSLEKAEALTKDIINSSMAIRKKYNKLKMTKSNEEEELNKTFKPILEPLAKIIKIKEDVFNSESKTTIRNKDNLMDESEYGDTPIKINLPRAQEVYSTPKGQYEARQRAKELGVIAQKYVLLHLKKENEKELDKVYGIRSDGNRWLLGDALVNIADDNIYIHDKKYTGTPGLFELLFLKNPDKKIYNDSDLKIYKDLLTKTSAYKQNYEPSRQINSNKGMKYKTIIQNLFRGNVSGQGMSAFKPRYEYWDDPNELVDRLRLLIASQAAGNNSHGNEILALIEEMKEASIIE